MQSVLHKKSDKSALWRGLIAVLLIFVSSLTVNAQQRNDDQWNSSKLNLTTVNVEVLMGPPPEGGTPFQNMAYGFKAGRNTIRKCGWYIGAMTNFNFFGAFRAAEEADIYPKQYSTSFIETDLGLTFHVYKPVSYHIGTGYFYRTKNYKDHDYNIVHVKGAAEHGLVLSTGFTWHIQLSDKYIREVSPEKVSLSLEFVSLLNFKHKEKNDLASYGVKLGVGICNASGVKRYEPIQPTTPQPTEVAPPVIAENTPVQEKKAEEVKTEQPTPAEPESKTEPAAAQPAKESRNKRVVPTVEIGRATEVTEHSLHISGSIRHEGSEPILQQGFCYSRFGSPSLSANSGSGHVVATDERGRFTATITNLKPGASYVVRAYVIDKFDTAYSDIITVNTKAILAINSVYDIRPTSATMVYNTTDNTQSNEVKERGICYASDTSSNYEPTVEDHTIARTDNALFQVISELEPGTHYFARAYTEMANGTVEYSDTVSFTTPYYLSTFNITNIQANTANVSGRIMFEISESIEQVGFCWSLKNPNPSIKNTGVDGVMTNGEWNSDMFNLKPKTNYYVRAYVKTTDGKYYYGNVVTFETLPQ